jgi:hypothetical protein
MFPTSISGEFTLELSTSECVDSVLRQIEHGLEEVNATSIVRTGNKITFRGGIRRLVSSANVLIPVGSGEIEVLPGNPGSVKYNLSCVEMLTCTTIVSIFLGLMELGASNSPTYWFLTPFSVWAFVFGLSYLTALFSLPAFVKRIVGA